MTKKGNIINTPKSIEEYCYKYLWKNYITDIIKNLLETEKSEDGKDILYEKLDRIWINRGTISGKNEFDAPPAYLKYKNEEEYNKWNKDYKENRRKLEQSLIYFFGIKIIGRED